jgi:hypothetical protein
MIIDDARCVTEIISRIAMAKAAFNKKNYVQIELKKKKYLRSCGLLCSE